MPDPPPSSQPRKISRRTFMKVSGAVGAGGYMAWKFGLPTLAGDAKAQNPGGAVDEKTVATLCLMCPAACGMKVRVTDGRAVKIEGTADHPVNMGKLCPKGQAALYTLYDPDRIQGPMKRVGARGEAKFEPISWEEALSTVATKLKELRDKGEPQKLAVMSGRNSGTGGIVDRFMSAYGSPNHVGHSSICADGSPQAHDLAQGVKAYTSYDWENTNYLLCFGGAFVEAWRPTTRLLKMFGHMRRGRPVRGKIVQVDTRLSVTAAKADEWLAVKPGTDGALALAIANVIVKENLYDASYLRNQTDAPLLLKGGKPWVAREWEEEKDGVKTKYQEYYVWDEKAKAAAVWSVKDRAYTPTTATPALLGEYEIEGTKAKTVLQTWVDEVLNESTPAWAQGITGVPAATIERIAREFATTKPAIATGERGSSMQTNGVMNRVAIHALNALVGMIEVKGGITIQPSPPLSKDPAVVQDEIAKAGAKQPRMDWAGTKRYPLAGKVYQDMAEVIQGDAPYGVEIMMVYYTNPLFSTPDTGRFYKAFEKIPFIVSFSPFMDESTAFADIILPDDTFLERWQDDSAYPSVGFALYGIRQPAVSRLYDTRTSTDVVFDLAHRIGGTVGESFPWNTAEEYVKAKTKGLWEAKKGTITAETHDEFWEKLKASGFWADPPHKFGDWNKAFVTTTKRYEIYASKLKKKIDDLAKKDVDKAKEKGETLTQEAAVESILKGIDFQARGAKAWLPHYEPPVYAGDAGQYPLFLNTYKLMTHAEGRSANIPHLQEVASSHAGIRWGTWVEINPGTAAALGIEDGDDVWVESQVGKLLTKAKVYHGAMPDVVNIPFDGGHRFYGRWASRTGQNPNDIMAHVNDKLGGLAAFYSTRVRITKASGGDA